MDVLKETDPKILVAVTAIIVSIVMPIIMKMMKKPEPKLVNLEIKKNEAKVVDKVCLKDIEDMGKEKPEDGKLVMCRCWRSKKFPYCDGAHVKHNKETGDNTGPLIIECTKPKK
mmetsp:Transcript_10113/g.13172  ORF Transcript_10113/g.13172 Transcript_10113/m.13172 type:complete len:114 (+) Transcript_10113:78-419(+)|eukprot:CAMPEP_0117763934 /NCGR_PEP_ID=MMETSP0947-20121206/19038_1 /TAXON_ID=44440 /ORGANISM="Chattonella subsalsa, Strain CCMP2191" /LENGTH=113 /DNA_ID=CAMNT_0005585945 /DNA_START=39 /DNA_END=380 /DNA_ORIENTATION=+